MHRFQRAALRGFVYSSIAAVFLVIFTQITFAQQPYCTERSKIVEYLAEKHQERTVAMGILNDGGAFEILADEKGGWSLVVTDPSGKSCFVASGTDWTVIEQPIGTAL